MSRYTGSGWKVTPEQAVPSKVHDAWGAPLAVGDVIVYPIRQASHMHLVKARIDEITERQQYGKPVPVLRVTRLEEASFGRQVDPVIAEARVTAIERVTKVG